MSIKHLWKTGLLRTSRKRADEKDIEEGGRMKGMSKKVRRGMWKKRTSVKGDVEKGDVEDVDEGDDEEGSRMNGMSRIGEDEKDDEEGGCRRRGGWKKGMPWKREEEEGGVENGGKMTRTSKEGTG